MLAGAALIATIRDLEEVPDRNPPEERTAMAFVAGVLAAAVWWLPGRWSGVVGQAGNPKVVASLSPRAGGLAGAGLLASPWFGRPLDTRVREELSLRWPSMAADRGRRWWRGCS